ncbi:hypothetical protein [Nereida ignava]|uniref:hypothetical protein n=1 Tax=Nereida ignava TaxID=282199 RepID=UPI003C6E6924
MAATVVLAASLAACWVAAADVDDACRPAAFVPAAVMTLAAAATVVPCGVCHCVVSMVPGCCVCGGACCLASYVPQLLAAAVSVGLAGLVFWGETAPCTTDVYAGALLLPLLPLGWRGLEKMRHDIDAVEV